MPQLFATLYHPFETLAEVEPAKHRRKGRILAGLFALPDDLAGKVVLSGRLFDLIDMLEQSFIGFVGHEAPVPGDKGHGLEYDRLAPCIVTGVHRLFECGVFVGVGVHPFPQLRFESLVFLLAHSIVLLF